MPTRRKNKVFCKNCGEELKLKRYANGTRGKYNKTFCSRKCLGEFWVGRKHPSFKGGRFVDKNGYVKVLVPGTGRYKLEHRLVVEELLGAKLHYKQKVHHIDGHKTNNNLDNLRIMPSGDHARLHLEGRILPEKRQFRVLRGLPLATKLGEVVSLLPEYRTYIVSQCPMCSKLFWHRKHNSTIHCSSKCLGLSRVGKKRKGNKYEY